MSGKQTWFSNNMTQLWPMRYKQNSAGRWKVLGSFFFPNKMSQLWLYLPFPPSCAWNANTMYGAAAATLQLWGKGQENHRDISPIWAAKPKYIINTQKHTYIYLYVYIFPSLFWTFCIWYKWTSIRCFLWLVAKLFLTDNKTVLHLPLSFFPLPLPG